MTDTKAKNVDAFVWGVHNGFLLMEMFTRRRIENLRAKRGEPCREDFTPCVVASIPLACSDTLALGRKRMAKPEPEKVEPHNVYHRLDDAQRAAYLDGMQRACVACQEALDRFFVDMAAESKANAALGGPVYIYPSAPFAGGLVSSVPRWIAHTAEVFTKGL